MDRVQGERSEQRIASVQIDESAAKFLDTKRTDGHAPKTIVKYQSELDRFTKFAKENKASTLQQLTVSLYDAYRKHRKEHDGLELYSLYNHAIIAKTWLKWCTRRQLVARSPLEGLEVKKPPRPRYPAATQMEVDAILGSAEGCLLAVLATAAFGGLRIGEIVALRVGDVDLADGWLRVRRHKHWGPKSQAGERSVPMHPRLLAILKEYDTHHHLARRKQFFTIPPSSRFPEGGCPINPRTINVLFQALAKKHDCLVGRANTGLTEHALRRYFKTSCIDAGVPQALVDIWVGHSSRGDMNAHYYRPQRETEWMTKVFFGESNSLEAQRAGGV